MIGLPTHTVWNNHFLIFFMTVLFLATLAHVTMYCGQRTGGLMIGLPTHTGLEQPFFNFFMTVLRPRL